MSEGVPAGPGRGPAEEAAVRALAQALRVSFRVLKVILAVVIASFLLSGIFSVDAGDVAIVLRFGRVAGVYRPGLHWTWPEPISAILRLPNERTLTFESDDFWYSPTRSERLGRPDAAGSVPASLRPGIDGYAITGDANILHAKWRIAYRVADPLAYWRAFGGVGEGPAGAAGEDISVAPSCASFLRGALREAVTAAAARMHAEDALRLKIDEFRGEVTRRLRERLARIGEPGAPALALVGEALLVAVEAPRQVAEAFGEVVRVEQDRGAALEAARRYAAEAIPRAEGEARRILARAEGDRARVVSEAASAADRAARLRDAFRDTRKIFVSRTVLDALRDALSKAEEVFLIRDGARIRIGRNLETERERARAEYERATAPRGQTRKGE